MGVIGIDMGGTNLRAGLVENGTLLKVESVPIKKNGNESEILDDIHAIIRNFESEKISGIGIGVPSVVDIQRGIVFDVQNIPSWKEVYLKDIIQSKKNVPVYINNDANCFVVGEKHFGKVKEYANIVGLIVGTGLGAGLVINNHLYSGANCGAGEFGMVPFKNHNLEYYCSGQFFSNEYGVTGEEIFHKAEKNDTLAKKIFDEFGSYLGEAIKVILYTFDPDIIVLGGSVSKSFKYFQKEMWKSINTFAYPKSLEKLKIEVSEKEHIAILGAAALYYDALQE